MAKMPYQEALDSAKARFAQPQPKFQQTQANAMPGAQSPFADVRSMAKAKNNIGAAGPRVRYDGPRSDSMDMPEMGTAQAPAIGGTSPGMSPGLMGGTGMDTDQLAADNVAVGKKQNFGLEAFMNTGRAYKKEPSHNGVIYVDGPMKGMTEAEGDVWMTQKYGNLPDPVKQKYEGIATGSSGRSVRENDMMANRDAAETRLAKASIGGTAGSPAVPSTTSPSRTPLATAAANSESGKAEMGGYGGSSPMRRARPDGSPVANTPPTPSVPAASPEPTTPTTGRRLIQGPDGTYKQSGGQTPLVEPMKQPPLGSAPMTPSPTASAKPMGRGKINGLPTEEALANVKDRNKAARQIA